MECRIRGVLQGYDNLLAIDSLLGEDVETAIGITFNGDNLHHLAIDLYLSALLREEQTGHTSLGQQGRNVGVETEVNLYDVRAILGADTSLVNLEDDVVEIVVVGISQLVQVESDRGEQATALIGTSLLC